jgi:phage shock protein PspC (stress-responsive transcriptional regulator)
MNKTVTVNVGGMVFHIEEQAYEKLKKYLDAIRSYFTTSDGRDEIIQDIESRIAEMFTERIGNSRQVVVEADVEFMINAMGRPEQVAGADDEQSNAQNPGNTSYSTGTTSERGYRRLYRDPDDKVVGGVCSGISYYIGIDPIWLRLLFAAAFFIFGSGFLLYIILLVIVPKAKTTAEKLEMKGQPVNIDNIKKTIEEEVDDLRNKFGKSGSFNNASRKGTSAVANFFDVVGQLIVNAARVFFKVIGFIFAFVLMLILFALFLGFMGMTGVISNINIPVYVSDLVLTKGQMTMGIIAISLVVGIPILMLLYRIIRSLFNIKTESKLINYSSSILFGIGVLIAIWFGTTISKEFRIKEQQRIDIPIFQPKTDTLYLDLVHPHSMRDESYYNSTFSIDDGFSINDNNDTIRISRVNLDIIKADGDKFELVKIVRGRGANRREAEKNANAISYEIMQEDSLIKFSEDFLLPKGTRFRDQKVQMILKVPVGKSIYLANDMDNVIYDVQNVTNTYDGDMVGRTWTMTENGLECLGSTFRNASVKKQKEHFKLRVNGQDVSVNDDEENNQTDTINWKNKDVKIHINKNGVVIDAKDKK